MPSDRDWQETVLELLCADTRDLRELALLAGADPATFYLGARLKGADLSGQDLRGVGLPSLSPGDVFVDDQTRFEDPAIMPAEFDLNPPQQERSGRQETGDYVIRVGSQTTAIWSRSRGLILHEPSVVAVRRVGSSDHTIQAVGSPAYAMLGRTPPHIEVIHPIQEDAVVDERFAREMLRHFLRQSALAHRSPRPRVLICASTSLSPSQKRVLANALTRSGASSVRFVEQAIASAVGMSLPIDARRSQLIVDIGDAVTCLSVIAGSEILYSHWVPVGLEAFERALIQYSLRNHNLSLGPVTGRNLLLQIAATRSLEASRDELLELRGRDVLQGVHRTAYVKRVDLLEAFTPALNQIAEAVAVAIHAIPYDHAAEISSDGIALSGTGAELRGLSDKLGSLIDKPVRLPPEPGAAALRGGIRISASAKLTTVARVHSCP